MSWHTYLAGNFCLIAISWRRHLFPPLLNGLLSKLFALLCSLLGYCWPCAFSVPSVLFCFQFLCRRKNLICGCQEKHGFCAEGWNCLQRQPVFEHLSLWWWSTWVMAEAWMILFTCPGRAAQFLSNAEWWLYFLLSSENLDNIWHPCEQADSFGWRGEEKVLTYIFSLN